ncbi:LLM class F420-dependent oxidoreductase [Pseudonocardia benzenivorans]|uniref:TIGR03617 family F420-dependent LLM class oxidoreductase n=1 Tax=Pseudonocardia dioxanivorans TaxID=240495 RepID=UPI001F3C1726|nr:TIGR03617 family F420-dependent LLM class oxidoreductase [Pseudonocardia dioxanivorans]GJF02662.1 LLM class F420-dependent oxidoreductase [Pseudonocardia sp. D17]
MPVLVEAVVDVRNDPEGVEAAAVRAEQEGYSGVGIPETQHDVFVALGLAARATERITLQSAIAVAFARTPMTLAMAANDITLISKGRFELGIGSQVKPHIERRFGMPWSRPAARMEEFVGAMRAIWDAFASGERLDVRGEFYSHTLLTEIFSPGPNPYGNPPVLLAAVGTRMIEVAGRVTDGIMCHPLTSKRYMSDVILPTLRDARGGDLDGFTVSMPAFVVLGADEQARARALAGTRRQIAFYASTPAYRPVLEAHGWEDLHVRLNGLSRRQAWDEMAGLIDDEIVDTFAVGGTPEQAAAGLRERFGGLATRLSLNTPYEADPELVLATAKALRENG